MESYEDFIQRVSNSHQTNDDDDDDDDDSHTPSSVIVFRGYRVLPPLLSEQQRDEMRQLRETAVRRMKRRSEEESHISFTDARTSDDIISSAPLTSTARSANQLRASPEDQTVLKTSHSQMMSSGYVTNDKTDVTCHSSWIATLPTATGSDIISHAPVDGASLEEEDVVLPLKNVTESLVNAKCDEGPYPMSLQNLLKKSQEYRRRRRQARALRPDEHSLSDKENEEKTDNQSLSGTVRSLSVSRFTSIPTPKFCRSPVRSAKKSNPVASGPPGAMMSQQAEQITQLELNLSSLKALISDLESTLTLSHTRQTLRPEDCGIGRENPSSIQTASEVTSADDSSVIGSSYDVDTPSVLWAQLTPEAGGHEGVSRVKRRLLMNEGDASTPRVMSSGLRTQEDHVTTLMEGERRGQQELLQSLAVRYQFLRSVSFPCPGADSRLEDTLPSLLASSVCTHTGLTDALHSSRLAALARGFLTRRLLRTERVSHLIRTIKDTQMFLQSFQRMAGGGRLDLMLQERVTLQLRAARHDLHQIFFSSSSSERTHMIHCDRELSRDRRLKPHDNKPKGFLSAATRKALERKKLVMLQSQSADRKFSPSAQEKWNLVPKICRVSKRISAR